LPSIDKAFTSLVILQTPLVVLAKNCSWLHLVQRFSVAAHFRSVPAHAFLFAKLSLTLMQTGNSSLSDYFYPVLFVFFLIPAQAVSPFVTSKTARVSSSSLFHGF